MSWFRSRSRHQDEIIGDLRDQVTYLKQTIETRDKEIERLHSRLAQQSSERHVLHDYLSTVAGVVLTVVLSCSVIAGSLL